MGCGSCSYCILLERAPYFVVVLKRNVLTTKADPREELPCTRAGPHACRSSGRSARQPVPTSPAGHLPPPQIVNALRDY